MLYGYTLLLVDITGNAVGLLSIRHWFILKKEPLMHNADMKPKPNLTKEQIQLSWECQYPNSIKAGSTLCNSKRPKPMAI